MANWVEKAKQKRRNRNRLVTLFLIYFMFLGLLAGVTFGGDHHGHDHGSVLTENLVPIIILTVFTILYWVVFLILIRRSNQRGDK